ncbi:MAG: DNA starvation/stationary phase protection protein [Chitinophagales bacterium]|nr:DNA starvation/stationary phase protection protein [Chitinophagales bacterium]MDW8427976.1 DNA starvation/stationary phase protection protein [Chitinophagales bacterium]
MHWNIKGKKFFELHARLEQMYQYLAEKADEVAERIKALEAVPLHSFEDFLEKAHIKSRKNISKSDDVVQAVRDDLIQLLERERKLLALAHEIGDEGTAALLSDAIRDQEKMAWMYEAYLD